MTEQPITSSQTLTTIGIIAVIAIGIGFGGGAMMVSKNAPAAVNPIANPEKNPYDHKPNNSATVRYLLS